MNRRQCAVGFFGFAFATAVAWLVPARGESGFVSLFNGNDLNGWRYGKRGDGENKSGKGYQVADGVLYCTKDDGGNLFTEKEYADFVFRFEFKLEPNSNNGVGIRTPLEGDAAFAGIEIQILDDSGPQYAGKLQPYQYHGSIYGVVPAKQGALKPVGEWNQQEITCKGSQITVKLNGQTIVDANVGDVTETMDKRSHPGLKRTKGHVGFLGHGTRVEFRKIEIKEL